MDGRINGAAIVREVVARELVTKGCSRRRISQNRIELIDRYSPPHDMVSYRATMIPASIRRRWNASTSDFFAQV